MNSATDADRGGITLHGLGRLCVVGERKKTRDRRYAIYLPSRQNQRWATDLLFESRLILFMVSVLWPYVCTRLN